MRKGLVFGVAALAVLVGLAALAYRYWPAPGVAYIDPADQAIVLRGKPVYANYCASCHGADLQGQPNWRERLPTGRLPAPPHDVTGHTWHHPDALLVDIVKHGLVPGRTAPPGYQSDMPAYGALLSDEDIIAVLAYIKSSWPPKAIELQKTLTLEQQKASR